MRNKGAIGRRQRIQSGVAWTRPSPTHDTLPAALVSSAENGESIPVTPSHGCSILIGEPALPKGKDKNTTKERASKVMGAMGAISARRDAPHSHANPPTQRTGADQVVNRVNFNDASPHDRVGVGVVVAAHR